MQACKSMEKNGKHNECNYLGHLELCEKALLDVTATFAPMLSQQPVNKLFLVWQCLSMSFWTQNSVGSRTLGELLMLLWMNKRTSQTSKTFQPFRIWDFKISGLWYVGFTQRSNMTRSLAVSKSVLKDEGLGKSRPTDTNQRPHILLAELSGLQ